MPALNPWNIAPTEHGTWLRSLSDQMRYPLVGYNFIAGMVPSNAADATNDISFTAGACVSNNGSLFPVVATTKQLDAAFALGVNAGGAPSGLTISNATYHAFALWGPKSRNSDAGFDSSVTAANLLADATVVKAGLTEYRRIFSFRRIGGANQLFSAVEINGGGLLVQIAPVIDFTKDWTGVDDAAQTGTSTVIPIGVQMLGHWTFAFNDASFAAVSALLATSFGVTDTAPINDATDPLNSFLGDIYINSGVNPGIAYKQVLTRASDAAIRYRGTSTTADHSFEAILHGWTDFRVS